MSLLLPRNSFSFEANSANGRPRLVSAALQAHSRSSRQPWQRGHKLQTSCTGAAVEDRTQTSHSASPGTSPQSQNGKKTEQEVRVRFAPSPTGNLHIGGARTALFNWLIAKRYGGKMILRVEDTDQSRSTIESEKALRRDLAWLGITCDEEPGQEKEDPDKGSYGPYRQSQRLHIYNKYVEELEQKGIVYKDFCTDEELEQMKQEAVQESRPPVYTGKWAHASKEEVDEMLAKNAPFCYRCRVPADKEIVINDLVRGPITFNSNNLGDFVVKRSNGMPVYNFAVAVDDHDMRISHVIRAEEHLPNTMRQVIVHDYLFEENEPRSQFGHVSLILGPNQQKLSKRHGATSVGEFKELGYLPEALVDYLSQLGWNDGTEQQFHSRDELTQGFSIGRLIKSPATFDKVKLDNTNAHYLKQLPREELYTLFGQQWVHSGLLSRPDSPFVHAATDLLHTAVGVLGEATQELQNSLVYPLEDTLKTEDGQVFMHVEIAQEIVQAHDSGKLQDVLEHGHETYASWVKSIGKKHKLKGKAMWMPFRLCLTGSLQGAELAPLMATLAQEDGDVKKQGVYVSLPDRIEILRKQLSERAPV